MLHAGHLKYNAFRCEISETDLHVSKRFVTVLSGDQQILSGWRGWHIAKIFRQRPAGDGHAGTVQQSGVKEVFEKHRSAADAMQVDHGSRASGSEAAKHRSCPEDLLQVSQSKVHARFACQCKDMEHAVCGAARGSDCHSSIPESGFS
jgi:hypothetical protein